VAKLQAILGLTSDQVSDLPPAAVLANRYAELELENHRLHEQLRALQQALHNTRYGINSHNGAQWSPESPTVSEFPTQTMPINGDDQNYGRDSKKRKISCEEEMPFGDGHHPLVSNTGLRFPELSSFLFVSGAIVAWAGLHFVIDRVRRPCLFLPIRPNATPSV
jgi:hypothetical protein